ncbi:LolA-like outer membrane lipoprotein chaperone [Sulfuricurvum sp.]|uniref:LolA-like outer membrane lipoprotein chaperone n=1 Tax=Sulfuricurvum sp. TaxID=2025608 RepID=UPI00199F61A2|nr:LolA-like outer membrane lipoprotein chaperone [Sulfuricurvum sp.]MBD3798308.1 outer membrane lipoprotein chaperone LolA [Campylobacterota bacterium]MBD3805655.1 outer membrane lipoprotein chaperone LolA [Sulfuricurvum sp.]
MRFLTAFLCLAVLLSAAPKDIQSFNSKFEQTITDDNGKIIRYTGELWAAKPQSALWMYQKPIKKSVFVNAQKITIIEPSIEQVTLRTLDGEVDFLQIIQQAKKVDDNKYIATIKGEKYTILFSNNLPSTISYTDSFDNKVVIKFTSPVQNKPIESSKFKPTIPEDYDIIKG